MGVSPENTHNVYFNRKCTWMQEFLLFFQQQAGQRGGIGPVGKIAHQYGTFRQGQGARPLQDVPLFVRADDPPAVEDRTEHPAGAQGREGRFQRGDAAACRGEYRVVGPGQPAKVEHDGICRAGCNVLQQVCVAVAVKLCRKAFLRQMGSGGGDGLGLDVKAQHPPAGGSREPAQERRIPAVAAGGVDAQPRGREPGGEEILHEPDGGQVRGAAADQLCALGLEIKFGPECRLARVCGQGSGKDGGLFPVVAAEGPQGFF